MLKKRKKVTEDGIELGATSYKESILLTELIGLVVKLANGTGLKSLINLSLFSKIYNSKTTDST